MAGHVMKAGKVGAVVVGADRIAGNGDVANKIGTYSVAVLAKENNIPFYVAAPISTLDLDAGRRRRDPDRGARAGRGHAPRRPARGAARARAVMNPAFDVTPNRYVTAIITEKGVARPPFVESLRALAES
jgi:methylthioribose-1-phosphate isomerase